MVLKIKMKRLLRKREEAEDFIFENLWKTPQLVSKYFFEMLNLFYLVHSSPVKVMNNQQAILVCGLNLLYIKGQTHSAGLNSTEDGARAKAIPIALHLMQMISQA